ncbi:putative aminoacrylate peracid reductase RutC [Symmachiella macrocystis]|uniref:Putative aminoacrylate peracid reductase RutC n=1 Tax=Symmachiella macrocystis TaxID=2527985 RepID=A0A5C6BCS6_9PLAN|nr:RidA family protein [Symmachiella macrocystis]TWU09407.1 putative aminoacrylate peracid reductase RutC [Symmachiella macrocystis]
MTNWQILTASIVVAALSVSPCRADDTRISVIETDPQTGLAVAVSIDNVALAHTSQLLPLDDDGKLIGPDDAPAQTQALLTQLPDVLKLADTDLTRVVKLNVYLADDAQADAVQTVLKKQLAHHAQPAITFVSGTLAQPGVLVALDAVAAIPGDGPPQVSHISLPGAAQERPATVSILPRGGVVYISGQAEKGDDLAARTRNTLANLEKTLKFLSLKRAQVVQLKSFLNPMTDLAVVEDEIAAHFQGGPLPAHVPVEWTATDSIEIELIAYLPAANGDADQAPLTFSTPPWMTSSPVFSRVATVGTGRRVYISGLYGNSATAQVPEIFKRLATILKKSQSDFDHLAKATYYVSDAAVSSALNDYRPQVYNPQRPPAASKAAVRGVGRTGRTITLDMIAVIPN